MNNRDNPLRLAGKAWSFLRRGDVTGLWSAARHRATLTKWCREDRENTLRFNYPLTSESTVLDVGGYRGNFVREIVARYDPQVYVFEPVAQFFEHLVAEFGSNPKVSIFDYGLSDGDFVSEIALADEASSIYMRGEMQSVVRLRDMKSVVSELGISRIDLIKINIEGGEYILLRRMLETGLVTMCQDIQVQFHSFYPDSHMRRLEIRNALQKTHFATYDYPFVWENWHMRPTNPTPLPVVEKFTETSGYRPGRS